MNETENVNIPFSHFGEIVTDSAELYALREHLKILMSSNTSGLLYKEEVANICGIDLKELNE